MILDLIALGYTLRIAILGSALLGFVSGVLSYFFISREQSILGDAIAHSTLPGVALAFLILLRKDVIGLLLGAALTGILAGLLIIFLSKYSRLHQGTILGVILSSFFGLGIVLMTLIQKTNVVSQAGLSHYLFGNVAFLVEDDLKILGAMNVLVLLVILLNWKEFKLATFDREYAYTIGINPFLVDILIMSLAITMIVVGIDLVGVVMMASLLIAPGLAARQWSNHFSRVTLLAGIFGAVSGMLGAYVSSKIQNMPPGPMIVIMLTLSVLFSIYFGTNEGIIWKIVRKFFYLNQTERCRGIECLVKISMRIDPTQPFELDSSLQPDSHLLRKRLKLLTILNYIKPIGHNRWIITSQGMLAIKKYKIKNGLEDVL